MQAVSHETYSAEVLEASSIQPVLVDFWGPRCGPCLKMEPWVAQLAERTAGRLKVVKLNSAENRRLCVELRVMGLPTFILYRDGQEVERLIGDGCTPRHIFETVRREVPDLDLSAYAPGAES
jgi:thioredoxin 1